MKKIIKLICSTALALLSLSIVNPVFAAEHTSIATSTGKVGLTAPGSGTGDLQLKAVPSLDFGVTAITGADMKLPLQKINNDDTLSHGDVVVSDLRGTGAGWQVTVRYGDENTAQTTDEAWTTSDGKKLEGAILSMPAATWTDTNGKTIGAPSISGEVTAVSDEEANVGSTASDTTEQGLGNWTGSMDKSGFHLVIPQGNKIGDYTANLLWTLHDTPKA